MLPTSAIVRTQYISTAVASPGPHLDLLVFWAQVRPLLVLDMFANLGLLGPAPSLTCVLAVALIAFAAAVFSPAPQDRPSSRRVPRDLKSASLGQDLPRTAFASTSATARCCLQLVGHQHSQAPGQILFPLPLTSVLTKSLLPPHLPSNRYCSSLLSKQK